MNRRKGLVVIATVVFGCVSISSAQVNKEQYELQERCGRRAAEVFAKENGNGIVTTKDGQIMVNYENHYSPRLNKCFYLEKSLTYAQDGMSKVERLYDLNENKEYGMFMGGSGKYFLLTCEIRDKTCRNEAEWKQLLKPYMDD